MELRPWPLPLACRLLAGEALTTAETADWHPAYPTPDTVDSLALVLGAHELAAPLTTQPPWWVWMIAADGQVVGDACFHGPPASDGPAAVEIGYAVVPPWRGRGVATRACGLLVAQAWRAGATTVLAETVSLTGASAAVLRHCGFVARADGVFVLERPA